ncbi:hypothetical protein QQ008_17305 [Fulvivirgaceae bacterium BMA10]|uniref:Uncharacterized protein n=1 Tax=Splendidivirga corallicola TaxID=3051826 RepID=A0ABT8KQX2_9BACT|nr:hypothetical protein [Fulvivirgaceae bacterium BMA10]
MKKIFNSILPALIFVFLFSCNDDDEQKPIALINVENLSQHDLEDLTINISGLERSYGTLTSGQASDFKVFELSYVADFVKFNLDGQEIVLMPKNWLILWKELEPGKKYTYSIDLDEDIPFIIRSE